MVRETYADSRVASFLKEQTIPLHVNQEQGEGPALAERYGVQSLPTLLLVDSKGNEIERFGGYSPPNQFIASVEAILSGESFTDLQKHVADDPSDLRSAYRLAMKYIDRGALEKAHPLLLRVADTENPHEELRLAGEVNLVILDSKGSGDLRPMEGFLESYPDSPFAPEIAVMLYDEYSKAGDAEKVVRVAELAVRTEVLGKDTRFLGRYAAYLVEHDLRPDRAQELIRMAVTLAPDDPAVHDRAADVYQRLGKLERAIDARKRAVETAGESERAKYGRRLKKLLETRGQ